PLGLRSRQPGVRGGHGPAGVGAAAGGAQRPPPGRVSSGGPSGRVRCDVLLAIASIPDSAEARTRAAAAAGLALADLNRRLAGTLPRVPLPPVPDDRGRGLAESPAALGF